MPKKYQIKQTHQAVQQITEMGLYIADVLKMPSAALNFLNKVEICIGGLAQFPNRCPLLEMMPWHEMGVRRFSELSFNLYYIVNEEQAVVIIVAVTNSRRDQLKVLGDTKITKDGKIIYNDSIVCDKVMKYNTSKFMTLRTLE